MGRQAAKEGTYNYLNLTTEQLSLVLWFSIRGMLASPGSFSHRLFTWGIQTETSVCNGRALSNAIVTPHGDLSHLFGQNNVTCLTSSQHQQGGWSYPEWSRLTDFPSLTSSWRRSQSSLNVCSQVPHEQSQRPAKLKGQKWLFARLASSKRNLIPFS
jgi:hypothetical protein